MNCKLAFKHTTHQKLLINFNSPSLKHKTSYNEGMIILCNRAISLETVSESEEHENCFSTSAHEHFV